MRIFVVLAITLACLLVCEGRHRKLDDLKKHLSVKSARGLRPPFTHHGHHRSRGQGRMRGKHMDLDHFKKIDVDTIKDDKWMKFPKKSKECKTIKCEPKHFCLTDPIKNTEKCVSYKNFREGRRLFRQYHRQKKLFKSENHGKLADKFEKKLQKAGQMKDVYELMHDFKAPKHHKKSLHKPFDIKTFSEQLPKAASVKEADPSTSEVCRPSEVYQLRKRLVGWFVLLHTESRQHHHRAHRRRGMFKKGSKGGKGKHLGHDPFGIDTPKLDKHLKLDKTHKRNKRAAAMEIDVEIHGHCKCSKSVMWDFRRLDKSRDGHLSHEELASIESIKREPCLKSMFKSCDKNGDGKMTRGEWCCCMADTVPPCAEKKRLSAKADWIPSCDKEGFFEREQCTDTGHCWCVDIDGNPIKDTKVHGSAHCGKFDPNGKLIKE